MKVTYKVGVLQKAFKARGMAYAELAFRTRYSEAWVRRLLSKNSKVAEQRAIELCCKALKVPITEVLN